MIGLLKMFGKGILYVIGFPFFVAALILFGAIGVFLFAFQLIKSIFYFFTGRKFFPELPEDQELRLMKEKAAAGTSEESQEYTTQAQQAPAQSANIYQTYMGPMMNEQPEPAPQPAPVMQEAPKQGTIEQAVFLDLDDQMPAEEPVSEQEPMDEYVEETIEEAMIEEPLLNEETPTVEEEQVEEEPVIEAPVETETIETSIEEAKFEEEEHLDEYVPKGSTLVDDYEDEEDTSSGVSIDYDL